MYWRISPGKWWHPPKVGVAALVLLLLGSVGFAQTVVVEAKQPADTEEADVQGGIDGKLTPEQVNRAWRRHWRTYASSFVAFGSQFLCCPKYNPHFPSSRGVTAEQISRERTTRVYERFGDQMNKPREIRPPREEAEAAANSLPAVALGEYGYVHSFMVDSIVGPDEMLVSSFWLVDAEELGLEKARETERLSRLSSDGQLIKQELDRRFSEREAQVSIQRRAPFAAQVRLKGISTDRALAKTRFAPQRSSEGIQIAIVGIEQADANDKNLRRLVAVAVSMFRQSINEQQFEEMLTQRGMDREKFVDLVLAQHRDDYMNARQNVFAALQRALPPLGPEAAESSTAN